MFSSRNKKNIDTFWLKKVPYQELCHIKWMFPDHRRHDTEHQGPVVQSVVSLTSSLRVISLIVLADSIYNILIFFAEKM